MIKVLQIVSSMNAAGVEVLWYNMYKNMDKEKIHFDFAYYVNENGIMKKSFEDLGCRTFKLSSKKRVFRMRKELKDIIRSNNYDIIHFNQAHLSLLPLIIAWRCNVKIRIVHAHLYYRFGFFKKIYTYFLGFLVNIFSTSNFACCELAGRTLWPNFEKKKKSFIMYNAIDIDKFMFSNTLRKDYREKYEVEDKFVIGCVARLTAQKNLLFLLEVFKSYLSINSKSHLMLVGGGKLENQLKKYVDKEGLGNKVTFTKYIDNSCDYYSMFDVFVLPSLYEGFGIVFVEAQINGLEVISSDRVPYSANVLGKMKMLSLKLSITKWAEQIEELRKHPNNRNDNSHIEIIGKHYDVKEEAHRITDEYERLVKNSTTR